MSERKNKAKTGKAIVKLGLDEIRKQEFREQQRRQTEALAEKLQEAFAESMRIYVHPKVSYWHEMVTTDSDGEQFRLSMRGQGVGFLPVFLTEEDYKKQFPDSAPMVYEAQVNSKSKPTGE